MSLSGLQATVRRSVSRRTRRYCVSTALQRDRATTRKPRPSARIPNDCRRPSCPTTSTATHEVTSSYCVVIRATPPTEMAEYCFELVCLCVCLSVNLPAGEHISRTTRPIFIIPLCLQCFDAVGWAAGRASGL